MEIKSVVCLAGETALRDARKQVERFREGKPVVIELIINTKPFRTIRYYIAGGGKILRVAADRMLCLDCGRVKTRPEIHSGILGLRIVYFCRQCELQIVSAFTLRPGLRAELHHYHDRLRYVEQSFDYRASA